MTSSARMIMMAAGAAGLMGVAACSPSASVGPELALEGTADKADVGTHKIGKPYKVGGKWYTPKHDEDYDAVGMASWYGPGFHGKRTANGERFNQNAMTAAHTTLPLPSFVRVTNVATKKSIVVRVNDRGPFSRNRIIDLSKGAAKELDFIRNGHAKVRVEYLGPAPIGGGDKETAVAAKTFGTAGRTRLAKADTEETTAKKGRGFFGFGARGREAKDEKPVDVRLASTAPRTDQEKTDALLRPRDTNLPGVGGQRRAAPLRVAGIPGGDRVAPPPEASLSAEEPISPTSPAYAAVRQDGGTVSAPIKVAPEELAQAYTAPTLTTGAIDAVIAMEPKAPPVDPLPTPSAPADGRFEGAHDMFAATGAGALYQPTGQ